MCHEMEKVENAALAHGNPGKLLSQGKINQMSVLK